MCETDDKAVFNKLRNIVDACLRSQVALYEGGVLSDEFDDAMYRLQKSVAGIKGLRAEMAKARLERGMRVAQ